MISGNTGESVRAFLKLLYLAPLFWGLSLLSFPHRRKEQKRQAEREVQTGQSSHSQSQCLESHLARRAPNRVQVPDPLPPRKRRLSLSLDSDPLVLPLAITDSGYGSGYGSGSDDDESLLQRSHDQRQSPLFAKLPLELRRMIYHEAVGGKRLHVVQKGRRFVHIPCRSSQNDGRCLQNECWIYPGWDEGKWSDERASTMNIPSACSSLLMLSRTCRQIYTESLPILYSDNTLSFNTLPNLLHFPLAILPTRINDIRKLEFKWHFVWPFHQKVQVPAYLRSTIAPPGHDEATWSDVWRMIRDMRGLRELRVTIMFNGCIPDRDWEIRVLAPLIGIGNGRNHKRGGGLDVFEIDVPWAPQGNDWSNASFDIRYRDLGLDLASASSSASTSAVGSRDSLLSIMI